MKKISLILLMVVVTVSLISTVLAIESESNRIFLVNDASGTVLIDSSFNQNGEVSNALIWESTGGKVGGALFPNALYNGNFTNSCAGDYTLTFWYNSNTTDGSFISNPLFTTENNPAPGNNPRYIRFDDFTTFRYALDSGNVWLSIPTVTKGNYEMYTIRRNSTPSDTLELFVNTTSQGVKTDSVMNLPTPFNIGGRTSSGFAFGRFDIIRIVCSAVNNSVIADWWNNGAGTEAVANNIPITKNVSITPFPLGEGNTTKGHANYTDLDGDVAGGNQTYWYINKSIINEANNSFILLGGNITLNSNITFSARYNDTKIWGNWTNSSALTVGDTTVPTLTNCIISSTSITDASGNTIIINCTAVDNSNIESMSFDLNGTLNTSISFSFSQASSVSTSYIIFESLETLKVGSYSIMNVTATDTSSNKLVNSTNFHFTVTSAPIGGSSPAASGGGGGASIEITEIVVLGNLSLILRPSIIDTYAFICGTFRQKHCRYSLTLTANKVLDRCISKVFECKIIGNNTILVALNSSNSSTFINKVSSTITLIDKAQLAKTITASVRFINWGYSLPIKIDIESRNYRIFNLQDNKPIGIRLWFLASLFIVAGAGTTLAAKYR